MSIVEAAIFTAGCFVGTMTAGFLYKDHDHKLPEPPPPPPLPPPPPYSSSIIPSIQLKTIVKIRINKNHQMMDLIKEDYKSTTNSDTNIVFKIKTEDLCKIKLKQTPQPLTSEERINQLKARKTEFETELVNYISAKNSAKKMD